MFSSDTNVQHSLALYSSSCVVCTFMVFTREWCFVTAPTQMTSYSHPPICFLRDNRDGQWLAVFVIIKRHNAPPPPKAPELPDDAAALTSARKPQIGCLGCTGLHRGLKNIICALLIGMFSLVPVRYTISGFQGGAIVFGIINLVLSVIQSNRKTIDISHLVIEHSK